MSSKRHLHIADPCLACSVRPPVRKLSITLSTWACAKCANISWWSHRSDRSGAKRNAQVLTQRLSAIERSEFDALTLARSPAHTGYVLQQLTNQSRCWEACLIQFRALLAQRNSLGLSRRTCLGHPSCTRHPRFQCPSCILQRTCMVCSDAEASLGAEAYQATHAFRQANPTLPRPTL